MLNVQIHRWILFLKSVLGSNWDVYLCPKRVMESSITMPVLTHEQREYNLAIHAALKCFRRNSNLFNVNTAKKLLLIHENA